MIGIWLLIVGYVHNAHIYLLKVAVSAGCVALPALLNIKQVMQQRHVSMWTDKDELPIEIDLGQDSR